MHMRGMSSFSCLSWLVVFIQLQSFSGLRPFNRVSCTCHQQMQGDSVVLINTARFSRTWPQVTLTQVLVRPSVILCLGTCKRCCDTVPVCCPLGPVVQPPGGLYTAYSHNL